MTFRAWLLLALFLGSAAAIALALPRIEGEPPSIEAPAELILGTTAHEVVVTLEDSGTGLRNFSARLIHGGGSKRLQDEIYPGSWLEGSRLGTAPQSVTLTLDVAELQVPDGSASLVLTARDWSWRDALKGNRTELSIPISVDTRAPAISPISGLTYVRRGGSGAAVYRVEEEVERHGVRVGNAFFKGFDHPAAGPGTRVAIFAIPVDAPPNPAVELVAVDRAGNEGRALFNAKVQDRPEAKKNIGLDRAFLERVAAPLAKAAGISAGDAVAAFQAVNSDLRVRNEEEIRRHIAAGTGTPLFSGAFTQMRGSQVMSRFAELRSYQLDGKKISQARHYGFDLASTANAPITASAAGRVLFAADLGIYGNCVLVDHGLGLTTLYGHLSHIEVAAGDAVEQGQRLGLSGATGLAGGDHLHFAILAGDTYVDPVEWWDAKWGGRGRGRRWGRGWGKGRRHHRALPEPGQHEGNGPPRLVGSLFHQRQSEAEAAPHPRDDSCGSHLGGAPYAAGQSADRPCTAGRGDPGSRRLLGSDQ